MQAATFGVQGMIAVLEDQGVEKRLSQAPGVQGVEASYLSCTATVYFDETVISEAEIKALIDACGYHCTGLSQPKHICMLDGVTAGAAVPHAGPDVSTATPSGHAEHRDHGLPTATPPRVPALAAGDHAGHTPTTSRTASAVADAVHSGHVMPAGAEAGEMAAMAHEMGHGGNMSMEDMVRDMRNRFFVTAILAIPVFLYSPLFTDYFGIQMPQPFGMSNAIISFLFATPAVLYGGWVFYLGAWRGLKNGTLNMAVLVTLSVLSGYSFSVAATFLFEGEIFYEAATLLLAFVLFGHWMEMRARAGASQAIQALMNLAPPRATVIRNGQPLDVSTAEVVVDDIVLIRPGDKIPNDPRLDGARPSHLHPLPAVLPSTAAAQLVSLWRKADL